MSEKYYYLGDCKNVIEDWWEVLQKNRGDRAILKRASCAEDVLLTPAFHTLWNRLPETRKKKPYLLDFGMVAALLARVKVNNSQTEKLFAMQLATPLEGKGKAPFSEMKFQQLIKSRSTDEFFIRMNRAIQMLNCKVNILSLADDILHWCKEFRHGKETKPLNRLAVQWAEQYYDAYREK